MITRKLKSRKNGLQVPIHHLYYFYQLGRLFSSAPYLPKTYREYCNDLDKVVCFHRYFLDIPRLRRFMLDITLCQQGNNMMNHDHTCLYSYVWRWSSMDAISESNVWIGNFLDTYHISLLLSTCCVLHVSLIGNNDINVATKDTNLCGRDEYKRETYNLNVVVTRMKGANTLENTMKVSFCVFFVFFLALVI